MVSAMTFGNLPKIWAVIWGDAIFLLFSVCSVDFDLLCSGSFSHHDKFFQFYVYAQHFHRPQNIAIKNENGITVEYYSVYTAVYNCFFFGVTWRATVDLPGIRTASVTSQQLAVKVNNVIVVEEPERSNFKLLGAR